MTYQPRFYRGDFSTGRFQAFCFAVGESDLWVGVDKQAFCASMVDFCKSLVAKLRKSVEVYIGNYPEFLNSLEPLITDKSMPGFAKKMIIAGSKAGVGPMASIAGYFAGYMGWRLLENYKIKEVVIENGGDIFAKVNKPLLVSIYAGESFFSGKVGVVIPRGTYGICTSSGTVGHSYSKGNSDGVMIVCRDITLADALATSHANSVENPGSIDSVIAMAKSKKEILSCIAICRDKIGICGGLEVFYTE